MAENDENKSKEKVRRLDVTEDTDDWILPDGWQKIATEYNHVNDSVNQLVVGNHELGGTADALSRKLSTASDSAVELHNTLAYALSASTVENAHIKEQVFNLQSQLFQANEDNSKLQSQLQKQTDNIVQIHNFLLDAMQADGLIRNLQRDFESLHKRVSLIEGKASEKRTNTREIIALVVVSVISIASLVVAILSLLKS
jgi:chromosome segregation ATPase